MCRYIITYYNNYKLDTLDDIVFFPSARCDDFFQITWYKERYTGSALSGV
jgi:hypothetical protein